MTKDVLKIARLTIGMYVDDYYKDNLCVTVECDLAGEGHESEPPVTTCSRRTLVLKPE